MIAASACANVHSLIKASGECVFLCSFCAPPDKWLIYAFLYICKHAQLFLSRGTIDGVCRRSRCRTRQKQNALGHAPNSQSAKVAGVDVLKRFVPSRIFLCVRGANFVAIVHTHQRFPVIDGEGC